MDRRKSYESFFTRATRNDGPYAYQTDLAVSDRLYGILDRPTGLGKTAAVVVAWLWRRCSPDSGFKECTPRRLVYCLPMRVLVEQTQGAIKTWLENLDLTSQVKVYLLMGGEAAKDWDLYPEQDAILVGTQDMLLSRALNRGYGMSRYRWPMHFGLLNNDCLWVMDEVQLMGNGLATTAQLDAFQQKLWQPLMKCEFLWMSATLGQDALRTRDRQDWKIDTPVKPPLSEEDKARASRRLRAEKTIQILNAPPKATKKDGSGILDNAHPGRLSLVVVNTVPVAQTMYADLRNEVAKPTRSRRANASPPEVLLVHGRFRPMDRRVKMKTLLDFVRAQENKTGANEGHPGLVLVSTQVIEAGVDISGVRLWSELAPWASVIQRLGRLNREGAQPDAKAVFWMPKQDKNNENAADSPNAKRIGPYDKRDLEIGKRLLGAVLKAMDAGKAYRDALDEMLALDESSTALRIQPDAVIRPDDLYGLFSTEPDLAGGFTNVSQFVRNQDRNADVLVFWRDFNPKTAPSDDEPAPSRDELCCVPFYEMRRFLGNKGRAWEWNFERAAWERRQGREVFAGMTLLLARVQGGYSDETGWTGNADDQPGPYPKPAEVVVATAEPLRDALNLEFAGESNEWVPLEKHLGAVERQSREILCDLGLRDTKEGGALVTAARWHDWGKSLARWQEAVRNHAAWVVRKCEEILAKQELERFHDVARSTRERLTWPDTPGALWGKWPDIRRLWSDERLSDDDRKRLRKLLYTPFNAHLRHEAASGLAAWRVWRKGRPSLSALAVYLIASHHGKVRTDLRSIDRDDEVFGLHHGDCLQPVPAYFAEAAELDFESRTLGPAGMWDEQQKTFTITDFSWTGMIAKLIGTSAVGIPQAFEAIPDGEPRALGPFGLAYLEAMLRAADARASSGVTAMGETK